MTERDLAPADTDSHHTSVGEAHGPARPVRVGVARSFGPAVLLLVTVVGLVFFGPGAIRQLAQAQTRLNVTRVQQDLMSNEALAALSNAFKSVAEIVEPSVVYVRVAESFRGRGGLQGERPTGAGSGWVYDEQGHIITNNHVVEDADRVTVRFSDGSEFDAEVVATDPPTDVAVLKIDAQGLIPARIAEDPVQQGEIVFAFGSPLGFDFSVSQGIVSAQGRDLGILDRVERDRFGRPFLSQDGYENFIQTDAAINRGNSGGPLTNIYGEVVGMNSAIAGSRSPLGGGDGFIGLGFAIPVHMVTRVADQIIRNGEVRRGFLGIGIRELTPPLAETFAFQGKGVLVQDLVPESPAGEAGIQPGDIITHVNGRATEDPGQLRILVSSIDPGTEVEVTVFRDGESMDFDVTLGEAPGQRTAMNDRRGGGGDRSADRVMRAWGIEEFSSFTAETAEMLDQPFRPGVLIEAVAEGSTADRRGLSQGMIIHRVGRIPVETVGELRNAVAGFEPGQLVRLSVYALDPFSNGYMNTFIALRVPEVE